MCGGCSLIFLSLSAKKEEEDTEDKKSIKKRIKELKVLDPKIAQNLCKYLFPFYLLLKKGRFIYIYREIWYALHLSMLLWQLIHTDSSCEPGFCHI